MKKDLRRTYYLAMKSFIYDKDRFEDKEFQKYYNIALQTFLIEYYEEKIKELDLILCNFLLNPYSLARISRGLSITN